MKIVCATSVALGVEAFASLGDVGLVPERDITAAVIRDADALIARSKVRVNRDLLEGSRVSFVGTATAGTDHLDLRYLEDRQIAWTAAPGCNANSVAEYVVAALLWLSARRGVRIEGRTVAIVGVGHVGARVEAMARALGLRVLLNDPPRRAAEGNADLRSLDEVLPAADIVTLHVPLTDTGAHATRGMVDCRFLSQLKPGCVFVNASRGEVVDEDDLLLALDRGWVSHAVLDVFQDEPRIRRDVAERAALATPHIAGYSFQGRVRGTWMCYEAACRFFEQPIVWAPDGDLAAPRGELRLESRGHSDAEALHALVRGAYDIEADDRALREGLGLDDAARGTHFQRLRMKYPERYEFPSYRVVGDDAGSSLRALVRRLGFQAAT